MQNLEGRVVHEIAMNPQYFHIGDKEAHSTLVHEMVHAWREDFGELNRKGGKGSRGYHDKVWGRKMIEIGLIPSHSGHPGGRQTGTQMSHYIRKGGPFDLAFAEFEALGRPID